MPSTSRFFRVFWFLRLPQLFSTCVAFSLVADMGFLRGAIGNWSMAIWCLCFAMTLVVVIVEYKDFQSFFPFYWYNFPVTYACYAALVCLSISIIYSITYVQFLPYGLFGDRAIAATAFSCVASVFYAMDVAFMWNCYKLDNISCYMHTVPGLLKVLETFMAGVIFAFLSNTSLYMHQPALEWCVAVYSICFILSSVALLLSLWEFDNRLLFPFPIFQLVINLLSILLYVSALLLWPLYQCYEEFVRQHQRSSDGDCGDELTYHMCTWDQRLAVAILTAINLLVYVADLVYWARQVSVGTEGPVLIFCSQEVSSPLSDIL
ncbi:myeloid-associated differentiation marker-like [Cervus canadensis]|uniref:myeloid-associated differentiation marker-like n=1 Tax=Cervus canadensis TaxID=1574408 RepID=UPI001C9E8D67|nr:myeloid-associated differentiation marker-like [Cervus canadensis]